MRKVLAAALLLFACLDAIAGGAEPASGGPYEPQVGQAGKDVVWVPTPDAVVRRMLQMAQVRPEDHVIDLGSGDGRTVLAAAKDFGATALGIEFNPDMVALSRKSAAQAGVADRARFAEGDIFKADFSKATVVTLYLLPGLNIRLRPRLLQMRPGTRVVSHQFDMGDWRPDERSSIDSHTVRFWVVPARIAGKWRLVWPQQQGLYEVEFTQKYQAVEGGVLAGLNHYGLRDARLRGERIEFAFMDQGGELREFAGRAGSRVMEGSMTAGGRGQRWQARRL